MREWRFTDLKRMTIALSIISHTQAIETLSPISYYTKTCLDTLIEPAF